MVRKFPQFEKSLNYHELKLSGIQSVLVLFSANHRLVINDY